MFVVYNASLKESSGIRLTRSAPKLTEVLISCPCVTSADQSLVTSDSVLSEFYNFCTFLHSCSCTEKPFTSCFPGNFSIFRLFTTFSSDSYSDVHNNQKVFAAIFHILFIFLYESSFYISPTIRKLSAQYSTKFSSKCHKISITGKHFQMKILSLLKRETPFFVSQMKIF